MASLVLLILILKTSDAERPLVSAAVTLTVIIPTSVFTGVPLKIRVAASKDSQLGNTFPSDKVAVYVSESPSSASENIFELN